MNYLTHNPKIFQDIQPTRLVPFPTAAVPESFQANT